VRSERAVVPERLRQIFHQRAHRERDAVELRLDVGCGDELRAGAVPLADLERGGDGAGGADREVERVELRGDGLGRDRGVAVDADRLRLERDLLRSRRGERRRLDAQDPQGYGRSEINPRHRLLSIGPPTG